MTPEKRVGACESALPAPELVSLLDGTEGPETTAQAPWWAEYGGTRDPASGVIAFPPGSLPPCRISGPCAICASQRKGV